MTCSTRSTFLRRGVQGGAAGLELNAAIVSSSSRSVLPSSVLAVNPSSEMRATVDGRTPYPATRSSSSLDGARGNGEGGAAACAGGPRSHRNGCGAEKASLGSIAVRGFRFPDLCCFVCFVRYTAATVACDGPPGARIRFPWAALYCSSVLCYDVKTTCPAESCVSCHGDLTV
jgi:hypothetical protein